MASWMQGKRVSIAAENLLLSKSLCGMLIHGKTDNFLAIDTHCCTKSATDKQYQLPQLNLYELLNIFTFLKIDNTHFNPQKKSAMQRTSQCI